MIWTRTLSVAQLVLCSTFAPNFSIRDNENVWPFLCCTLCDTRKKLERKSTGRETSFRTGVCKILTDKSLCLAHGVFHTVSFFKKYNGVIQIIPDTFLALFGSKDAHKCCWNWLLQVAKLCQFFEKRSNGEPLDLAGTFNVSIVNALWSIITGDKLDLEDFQSNVVVSSLNHLVRNATPISPVAAALPHPTMAKWPVFSKMSGFTIIKPTFEHIVDLITPYVDNHRFPLHSPLIVIANSQIS